MDVLVFRRAKIGRGVPVSGCWTRPSSWTPTWAVS